MSVAVITGAASGMGRACIDRLGGIADTIVAVDLSEPDIKGTIGVACDVSDPVAVRALAAKAAELGRFRALVHAAGISPTMGQARRIFDINLLGTCHLLDAFEPLVTTGSAAVCFSSSSAYQIAPYINADTEALVREPRAPGFLDTASDLYNDSGLAYAVSKVGVVRAAASASVRWGRAGGRVNSIAPGLIDTPMGRQEFEQQHAMQEMLDKTPLSRMGDPTEIAETVAFLLSDQASFISGIDLLVDGGMLQGTTAI